MRKLIYLTMFSNLFLISCDDTGAQVNNNSSVCGNNTLEFGEECDGDSSLIDTCESLGFHGGILKCSSGCNYDISGCTTECNVCEALTFRCSGDILEICSENENSCTFWETDTDCSSSGLICSEVEGTAECTFDCTDSCTEGDFQCNGTVLQECLQTPGQCTVWADSQDCTDTNQICSEAFGTASCVDHECTDDCTPGDAQCQGNSIFTCEYGTDGCTEWVEGTVCQEPTPFCDDSEWPVVCTICVDECNTNGETRCNGTYISTCTENTSGCLEWVDGENCADTGLFCDDTNGPAECTESCVNQCTPESSMRCDGNNIQTCTNAATGCNVWQVSENCDATGTVCQEDGLNASCVFVCNNECLTEGEMWCTANSIMECLSDLNGCLYINEYQDCTDSGAEYICSDLSGTPQCEYNCSNTCSVEGSVWCNGDIIEECLSDTNGCLYVSTYEDCAMSNRVCHDDGSQVQCECNDECATYGDSWCAGDVIMECTSDAYGCNIIATLEDCLDYGNYYCDDSAGYAECLFLCTHECDLGDGYCYGDDLYQCTEDYDGCRYYEWWESCSDYGLICVESGLTANCI